MNKKINKSLFIFRRDLRLDDNTALINAMKKSELVIPCFIFDTRQVGVENKFRSINSIQFMIESLKDLEGQLKKQNGKLYLFYGIAEEIIPNIIKKNNIDAIFFNKDYTPFSMKRDEAIAKICRQNSIELISYHDELLIDPDLAKTINKTPYTVFSAFFKHCSKHYVIKKPIKFNYKNFYSNKVDLSQDKRIYNKILTTTNKYNLVLGGRKMSLNILKNLENFKNYSKFKDFPIKPTTHLSAYHKFGTVSIRESYHAIQKALGENSLLIRQLYWRDFFTYIAYHSPFVFGFAFKEKYNNLLWQNNNQKFKLWCKGETGFPIVDAGMRQLNKTGFMHNRVRLIVASFLVKDLHIDWKWGEKYFAQKLIDYDPAVNNGNWQWVASTGCDAQPFFRIFNPWLQQKKFDPDCQYIKTWVPELNDVSNNIIHKWYDQKNNKMKIYIKPIVNHKIEAQLAKQIYKHVT